MEDQRHRIAVIALVLALTFPTGAYAATLDNASILNVLSGILTTFSRMLASLPAQTPIPASSNNYLTAFAPSQRIDNLANVTISNATVHGVAGLAAADIPSLPYLSTSGGTLTGDISLTNATSTNFFATLGHFTTGIIDSLTATAATITNLIVTTIIGTNATFTNATTTNATSTNLYASTLNLGAALTVANGGTGWSSLASGYIPFGNGSSAVATSSVLFWDNTNSRLGIGTSAPTAALDVVGQARVTNASNENSFRAGEGTPLGAPPTTPTAVTNGAGILSGTYQYAYTELDGSGETTVSAAGSITASNNTVRVTIGMPRRGVSAQKLYRKNPGSSTFNLVHYYGGGYFQNVWDDNVADAVVAAAAAAPSSDTSAIYNLEVNKSVKYFRTHPNEGSNPADIGVLTGNSGYVAGTLSIDAYSTIIARTYLGNSFDSFKTGNNNLHFGAYWEDVVDNNGTQALVTAIYPHGNLYITPDTSLTDQAAGGLQALSVSATLPAVTTNQNYGAFFNITGAGASSFPQVALEATLEAGYTGTSGTYGTKNINATASGGASFGSYNFASGASTQNIGVAGRANGGTYNIGVFGGLNVDPDAVATSSAAYFYNNVDTGNILIAKSSTLTVTVNGTGVGIGQSPTNRLDVNGGVAIGFSSGQPAPTNGLNVSGRAVIGTGTATPDSTLVVQGPIAGGRTANIRANTAYNSLFFGHSNTAMFGTLGGFSASGLPFIAFYAYHSTTANTLARASGTYLPSYFSADTSGKLTYNTAPAGAVDSDISNFTTRFAITNDGLVGVGTSSPDMLLSVGSATPVGNVAHFENSTGSCYINPTTGLSCSSDSRLKTNINALSDSSGIAALMQLNPVTYNWTAEAAGTPTHTGFIAQQVQPILPDLVSQGPDGYYTLNYAGFTPYLVKAVQELFAQLGDLAEKLVTKELVATNITADSITAKRITSDESQTQKLCVGSTCVTEDQLKALLANVGSVGGSSDPTVSGDTSTPSPDTTPPTIAINGDNPASIHVGDSYADLGASVTDNVDQNLGLKYFLNGALVSDIVIDTSAAATDTIDYVATDNAGNTSTTTRTVIVESPANAEPAPAL